ncbi:MAG TPA: hypothetical protein VFO62_00425, partial [Candidatus Binatia bacterium]|nr:hypothetical protein [Candidatus Binatia bacterium]
VVTWRGRLARGIADANGCRIYWDPGHGGTLLRVIGTPSRVAAVRQLYSWLAAEIDRLGSEAASGKGRSYGRSWRVGCASRVSERLADAAKAGRKEAERTALHSGASIVRVSAALATLDEARDDADRIAKTLGLRTTRAAPPRADGYHDGRKAGERIRLSGHAALGRGSNGRLRGGS